MKETKGAIAWAMKHHRIVLMITGMLVLFGVYALWHMPKQEFPVFTIRQGVVAGVYPGATSSEVEEQLTKPLERFLFTYKEVKKSGTYSLSRDGVVYVFVELNDNVNNKDEVWSKIKHGLTLFKSQLPPGVLAVIANDDFGDTSALLISMQSETKTYRQLQKYMEDLEDRLRSIESVSNLRLYGAQNEQISIYLEKEKIATYGINILGLYRTLLTKGLIVPAGKVDNPDINAPIHISRPFLSERDLEEQIVYSDPSGNYIRLKDVATVAREYPAPKSYTTYKGVKCLILSAEMREGYNIVEYGQEVDKVMAEFEQTIPADIKIERIVDQPRVVNDSTTSFLKELLMAIGAVIIVTMVLLPLRVAGVAASSIPITIFISLGMMYMFGIELNTVTLAALIVVLGMIVDNSIVIIDDYIEKLDHGMPRWEASIAGTKEYLKAIFSATLAIGITFFPFLFTLTGQFNDFIRSFPWTILLTLSVSLLVAILIIPYFQYLFIRYGLKKEDNKSDKPAHKSLLDRVQGSYDKFIETVFRYPKTFLWAGIASVLVGIGLSLTLPLKLMPFAERDQFAVEIYLPQGSPLDETEAVARDMEALLEKDTRVESVSAFIGTGSPRFHAIYAPKLGGSNFAQFIVNTSSNEATVEMLDEYASLYAYRYPNAFVKFKQLDYQAGVDADIEVRLSSDNLGDLRRMGDSLMAELKRDGRVLRTYSNFEEMLPGVNIALDPVEANRLGISESILGVSLAARYGGMPVTTLWEDDYAVPVVLKSKWDKKDPVTGDVADEYVSGLLSPAVPLRQIATVSADWNQGQIVRRNGIRTMSVYADLNRGENINKMQSKVESIIDRMQKDGSAPAGIAVAYGGVKDFHTDKLPGIIGGLVIAILIIFFILVFHFKKVSLAGLVLSSTLLSILGGAIGLKLLGLDFSITGVLGVVSLIGIIVRNGIIMYDYTEELRHKHGYKVMEACIEAGKRRMRPIFLTSAAASMGVIPMIIHRSPLWCPMGTVICFGTMISMILILYMLPLMYWFTYRGEDDKIKAVQS